MIELVDDYLIISFPEVHPEARCTVIFQRTLRIPDDGREYPLPPGLGKFPLFHVDDYTARLPKTWKRHGGVFLPMYQAEALWIRFSGDYPFAIKVAAGKVNAITGKTWRNELTRNPQDYLVIPGQPWLDGFCVAKGQIRQFVAMPLGSGYSVEEQVTGRGECGGIQLVVYPMKREWYEKLKRDWHEKDSYASIGMATLRVIALAPGGLMRQDIYADKHGFSAWETNVKSRCFVHILNSQEYFRITRQEPPSRPPSAKDYTEAGLPWFEYYAADKEALEGAKELAGLKSVSAKGGKKGEQPLPENDSVEPTNIKAIRELTRVVREGEF